MTVLLLALLWAVSAWAGSPRDLPPMDDVALANFLRSMFNHLNTLECLTANPNASVLGTHGELKCATYSGNHYICMNTGTGPDKTKSWTCLNIVGVPIGECDDGSVVSGIDPTGALICEAPVIEGNCGSFDVDADSGDTQSIVSGDTLHVLGAGGITTATSDTNTVTIDGSGITSSGDITDVGNCATGACFTGTGTSSSTLTFTKELSARLQMGDSTTANTSGATLTIDGANAIGSGTGGGISIAAGDVAFGGTGDGGSITISTGSNGSVGGASANSGNMFFDISSGSNAASAGDYFFQGGNGSGTNRFGSSFYVELGIGTGSGGVGTLFVQHPSVPSNMTVEMVNFKSEDFGTGQAAGITDSTTIASERFNIFEAPEFDGVAGGGSEIIGTAATVYIEDQPSGSNITFTNGPYALWVDSGNVRFDGGISVAGPTTMLAGASLNVSSGEIASGPSYLRANAYTPALTNVANLDASTAYQCQYAQIFTIVTGSCRVDVDPTLSATVTQLGISLPVASNFGAVEDAAGACAATGVAGQVAGIVADIANDRMEMDWRSGDVTNQPMTCSWSYQVL